MGRTEPLIFPTFSFYRWEIRNQRGWGISRVTQLLGSRVGTKCLVYLLPVRSSLSEVTAVTHTASVRPVISSQFVTLSQAVLELEDPSQASSLHFAFDRGRVNCRSVSVCWGCCNKGPPTGWVKQQKLIISQSGGWKSEMRFQEGWFLLRVVRENLFHASLWAPGSLKHPLACWEKPPWIFWHHVPCVCVCSCLNSPFV